MSGEILTVARSISDAFDLDRLLIHQEIVEPGNRTAPAHTHSKKQEAILILSGVATLYIENERTQLKAGEVIGFKPGDPYHQIVNESDNELVILTIGTNDRDDVVDFADESRDNNGIQQISRL